MLHIRSRGHRPSGSGEDFKRVFYHIWAWWPSWSCDQDHLNKLLFSCPKESPYEIWVQLAQWFQRKRCLKMLTDDGRTDAGVTGILLAHPWAFGPGELIILNEVKMWKFWPCVVFWPEIKTSKEKTSSHWTTTNGTQVDHNYNSTSYSGELKQDKYV